MFNKVDGTRIFQLHRDIYHVTQGTLSITTYFGKLKMLWDELAAIDDLVLVCEDDIVLLNANKEKQKLIQFLIGLNETFASVRSALLMRQPLPSLSVAYSVLLQEENQRSVSNLLVDDPVDPNTAALNSVVRYGDNGGNPSRKRIDKSGWLCSFCGKKGHRVDTYWKKHGLPDNLKKKWNVPMKAHIAVSNSAEAEFPYPLQHPATNIHDEHQNTAINPLLQLTSTQVGHLLKLAQQNTSPISQDAHANMAGTVSITNTQMQWIVDSGATDHMTYCSSWLSNVKINNDANRSVLLPNGQRCRVTHTGSCFIAPGLILKDVLLVPDFRYNLIAVSKLTRDSNCCVLSSANLLVIQALSDGRILGSGTNVRGLYLLEPAMGPNQITPALATPTLAAPVRSKNKVVDSFTWHQRLGHASYSKLSHFPFIDRDATMFQSC